MSLLALAALLAGCAPGIPAIAAYETANPAMLRARLTRDAARVRSKPRRVAVLIGAAGDAPSRDTLSLAYQVVIEQGLARDDVFVLDPSGASALYPLTERTSAAAIELLATHLAAHLAPSDTLFVLVAARRADAEPPRHTPLESIAALARARVASLVVVSDVAIAGVVEPEVDGCRFAVIEPEATGDGVPFTRAFLSAFRARHLGAAPSILDAVRHAMTTDRATATGQRRPRIVEGCVALETLGLAGDVAPRRE